MKMPALIILAAAACLTGQFRDTGDYDPRSKFLAQPSATSFFDMSKLSVSHTFSAGYISTPDGSHMQNEYVAGINYRFSDPLSLRLDLGMSYVPSSSFVPREERSADFYLKSATLDYRPSDKLRMVIDFRNIRPGDALFYQNPFRNFSTPPEGE